MMRSCFSRAFAALGVITLVSGCAQDAAVPSAPERTAAARPTFSIGYRAGNARIAVGPNNQYTLDPKDHTLSDSRGRKLQLPKSLFTNLERSFDALDQSGRILTTLIRTNPTGFAKASKSPVAAHFRTRVRMSGGAPHGFAASRRIETSTPLAGSPNTSSRAQTSSASHELLADGSFDGEDNCTSLELAMQAASSEYTRLKTEFTKEDLDKLLDASKEVLQDWALNGELEASDEFVYNGVNYSADGIAVMQLYSELSLYAGEMSAWGCAAQISTDGLYLPESYDGIDLTNPFIYDCYVDQMSVDVSFDDGSTWEAWFSGDVTVCGPATT